MPGPSASPRPRWRAAYRSPSPAIRARPDRGGILCSYTPNQHELYRLAADCIDRILRGAMAADVPVQQPLRYDLVINLKTAKAMGLQVPRSLRLAADELIE